MGPLMAAAGRMPRVQTLAGLITVRQGDRVAARKFFEQALGLDPADNEAIDALVALDLEAGRRDEARRRVEARLAAAPRDPAAIAMAARMYDGLGMPAEAEAAWKQLLQIDASSVSAYEALARLYLQQHRHDQALAECDRILQRQPQSVAAHTLAGLILEGMGRQAEAEKRYLKALEIDPHAAMAANNLAWMYAEGGTNLETAMQLARDGQGRAARLARDQRHARVGGLQEGPAPGRGAGAGAGGDPRARPRRVSLPSRHGVSEGERLDQGARVAPASAHARDRVRRRGRCAQDARDAAVAWQKWRHVVMAT